ncbi:MAG: capsular biosynthesis protein [Bacteroidales bacterium]|nr:capsular biosynthesis protein [Bacteroidales bacterium]
MGLFNRSVKVSTYGLLEGRTDWHCHILPGVDDGFRTMEDSLAALSLYEKAGFKEVWLTPHIMEDIPNTTAALRQRFTDLQVAYGGRLRLHLASENMMDPLFEDRLKAGDLLPLPDKRLLVETSYFNPPMDMDGILSSVKSKGWYPLLAHPERYMYMDMARYEALKADKIEFQLNITSLVGAYGSEVKAKAEKLLQAGMYDYSGTDLHRLSSLEHLLSAELSKKILALIP